jgi:hypothetical protein
MDWNSATVGALYERPHFHSFRNCGRSQTAPTVGIVFLYPADSIRFQTKSRDGDVLIQINVLDGIEQGDTFIHRTLERFPAGN